MRKRRTKMKPPAAEQPADNAHNLTDSASVRFFQLFVPEFLIFRKKLCTNRFFCGIIIVGLLSLRERLIYNERKIRQETSAKA